MRSETAVFMRAPPSIFRNDYFFNMRRGVSCLSGDVNRRATRTRSS